jgi:hypothetical protein
MNAQLNYIVAQQHIADLHRDAERVRLARDAATRRGHSRDSTPITRLSAHFARLTARLAPTGLSGVNDTARTPLAPDPVSEMSTPTETLRADVL